MEEYINLYAPTKNIYLPTLHTHIQVPLQMVYTCRIFPTMLFSIIEKMILCQNDKYTYLLELIMKQTVSAYSRIVLSLKIQNKNTKLFGNCLGSQYCCITYYGFCYSNSYQESDKTMNAHLRNWGIIINKRSCKTYERGLSNTN